MINEVWNQSLGMYELYIYVVIFHVHYDVLFYLDLRNEKLQQMHFFRGEKKARFIYVVCSRIF